MMINRKFPQEIDALTSIRFFLALVVVFAHVKLFFPAYLILPRELAQYAVTGFFILSGMIMTHVYKRENFSKAGKTSRFYFKRFSRIYPLYILPLIMLIPFKLIADRFVSDSLPALHLDYIKNCTWGSFAMQFFGLQSITAGFAPAQYGWNLPGWSISTELVFYLFFPFLIPLIKNLNTRFLIMLLTILSAISSLTCYWVSSHSIVSETPFVSFFYMNPISRLVEFTLGMVCYEISLKININFRSLFLFTLVVELLIIFFMPLYILLLAPVFLSLLLSYLLIHNPKFLRVKFLTLLGHGSYSLYLVHFPILLYVAVLIQFKLINLSYLSLWLIIIGTIIFSIICYVYYEKPMTNYLRKKFL